MGDDVSKEGVGKEGDGDKVAEALKTQNAGLFDGKLAFQVLKEDLDGPAVEVGVGGGEGGDAVAETVGVGEGGEAVEAFAARIYTFFFPGKTCCAKASISFFIN